MPASCPLHASDESTAEQRADDGRFLYIGCTQSAFGRLGGTSPLDLLRRKPSPIQMEIGRIETYEKDLRQFSRPCSDPFFNRPDRSGGSQTDGEPVRPRRYAGKGDRFTVVRHS